MNQWRPPYMPPPYAQQQEMNPVYDNQFANPMLPNQPNQSSQPNMPQQPITPFDYFAKPQQPSTWAGHPPPMQGEAQPPLWNQKPNGVMSYFQDKDGQVDIDKMLNTVGQAAATFQQVSPLVKGLGSFMKGFK
ncbi:YppG family protein [Aquibacillus sediminis]|uniref:YppG family protein n=1 Tax=Aquibacillus sediminis TaxID=2574734 RepID=UPI001109EEBE|nr:YppG family protein [Aquibacillus sediminis]